MGPTVLFNVSMTPTGWLLWTEPQRGRRPLPGSGWLEEVRYIPRDRTWFYWPSMAPVDKAAVLFIYWGRRPRFYIYFGGDL